MVFNIIWDDECVDCNDVKLLQNHSYMSGGGWYKSKFILRITVNFFILWLKWYTLDDGIKRGSRGAARAHCDGVYSNYWNTLLRNLKLSSYISFYV